MKNVLITGAGRGLGLEFTRQLLDAGERVFATIRDPANAPALKALRTDAGDRLQLLQLDVAEPKSIEAMAQELTTRTSTLDLLVNNAGINSKALPEDQRNVRFGTLEPAGIERMIRVNAIGPVLVTQALKDLLAAAGGAKVVSISSWLGSITGKKRGGNYAYCASKTTLNMLTRAMAHDLRNSGIVSMVMNPGWVSTDMGGSKAELTPEQSVMGMLRVVSDLTTDDIGTFKQWNGETQPW